MKEKFEAIRLAEAESNETVSEDIVSTPRDTYFIHGVTQWSKDSWFGIRSPEVCTSLQNDSCTVPLRPYGYVLKVYRGAITNAFDRDVASKYDHNSQKVLAEVRPKHRSYSENELSELIENTSAGSHNEIWVKGDEVEIVGGYITEDSLHAPGANIFLKTCKKQEVPVHII